MWEEYSIIAKITFNQTRATSLDLEFTTVTSPSYKARSWWRGEDLNSKSTTARHCSWEKIKYFKSHGLGSWPLVWIEHVKGNSQSNSTYFMLSLQFTHLLVVIFGCMCQRLSQCRLISIPLVVEMLFHLLRLLWESLLLVFNVLQQSPSLLLELLFFVSELFFESLYVHLNREMNKWEQEVHTG